LVGAQLAGFEITHAAIAERIGIERDGRCDSVDQGIGNGLLQQQFCR